MGNPAAPGEAPAPQQSVVTTGAELVGHSQPVYACCTSQVRSRRASGPRRAPAGRRRTLASELSPGCTCAHPCTRCCCCRMRPCSCLRLATAPSNYGTSRCAGAGAPCADSHDDVGACACVRVRARAHTAL